MAKSKATDLNEDLVNKGKNGMTCRSTWASSINHPSAYGGGPNHLVVELNDAK